MDDKGIPAFLKITQAEREASWRGHVTPVPPPPPDIVVVEPTMETQHKQFKRVKTSNRLARMKQNLDLNKIPLAFRQWDPRKSSWVDSRVDHQARLKAGAQRLGITLESTAMDILTIIPYAVDNTAIDRGQTTIWENAADFEIQAKVVKAANRAGVKKVQRVEVTNPDGSLKETWTLDLDSKMLNKVGSEQSVPVTITQENTKMATKPKTAKKKSAAKKAKSNGAPKKERAARPPGVIATIRETMERERGASKEEMLAVLTKKFTDRTEAGMLNTVNIQAPKHAKKKEKDDKRGTVYYG